MYQYGKMLLSPWMSTQLEMMNKWYVRSSWSFTVKGWLLKRGWLNLCLFCLQLWSAPYSPIQSLVQLWAAPAGLDRTYRSQFSVKSESPRRVRHKYNHTARKQPILRRFMELLSGGVGCIYYQFSSIVVASTHPAWRSQAELLSTDRRAPSGLRHPGKCFGALNRLTWCTLCVYWAIVLRCCFY